MERSLKSSGVLKRPTKQAKEKWVVTGFGWAWKWTYGANLDWLKDCNFGPEPMFISDSVDFSGWLCFSLFDKNCLR